MKPSKCREKNITVSSLKISFEKFNQVKRYGKSNMGVLYHVYGKSTGGVSLLLTSLLTSVIEISCKPHSFGDSFKTKTCGHFLAFSLLPIPVRFQEK